MKLTALLLFFISMQASAQDIVGKWDGTLQLPNMQLRVVFNILKSDTGYSATMDSPDQGAFGIPFTTITFNGSKLTLTLLPAQISYEGTLESPSSIVGTTTQAGNSLPLNLTKDTAPPKMATVDPNAKYIETLVALDTPTGKLHGTLTTPKGFSGGAVALIIAGSGPTDRDCNNPMAKTDAYKKLAHQLAESKISTLRYDKRGIGYSAGAAKNETDQVFTDVVGDAKDWLQFLKKDKRFTTVTIIGHSEGSTVGMLASAGANKFISLAGPGRSADKILKEQLVSLPQGLKDQAYSAIDEMAHGRTVADTDPQLASLLRPSIQPYMISWFKYDPQLEIKKLTIPVLIVQGSSDLQILVSDAELLHKANTKSKLLVIDKMNHVLTTVANEQDNLTSYNLPELPLTENLTKEIVRFIDK